MHTYWHGIIVSIVFICRWKRIRSFFFSMKIKILWMKLKKFRWMKTSACWFVFCLCFFFWRKLPYSIQSGNLTKDTIRAMFQFYWEWKKNNLNWISNNNYRKSRIREWNKMRFTNLFIWKCSIYNHFHCRDGTAEKMFIVCGMCAGFLFLLFLFYLFFFIYIFLFSFPWDQNWFLLLTRGTGITYINGTPACFMILSHYALHFLFRSFRTSFAWFFVFAMK